MDSDEVMVCVECGKRFRVQNCGDMFAGGKEKEEYRCPYCSHEYHMMTSGTPHVSEID